MTHVKSHFCELPPAALVAFDAPAGLTRDAELDIRIVPAQSCRVRVMHEDAQSVTLGTLEGHPVVFLPRHGRGHRVSPSEINFRANIDAL